MRVEDYLVKEPKKTQIINQIYQITDSWGVNLHNTEGMVVHFGLNRFYEIGETEFLIVNDITNNYCGKFLFVFEGQTCPAHYHKKKHETFFVVKGRIRMAINKEDRVLEEGQMLIMDKNHTHSFTGLTNSLLLEISNASTRLDNFFDDKDIGTNGVI